MPRRDDKPKPRKERTPEEEIILLEDLAPPPQDVKGGTAGTILFGEDVAREQEKK